MYKVKQKDVIPALTGDKLNKMLNEFRTRDVSKDTLKKFNSLNEFLSSGAEGRPIRAIFNRIYGFIDKFMNVNIYPYSTCQAGCAHCCKIPVSVSAIEAAYIHQVTGKKLVNKDFDNVGLCPFLDTSTAKCSIYEVRPIECRSFASLDGVAGCEDPTVKHHYFNARQSEMIKHLKHWADYQSDIIAKKNNVPAEKDIRFWFGC